MGLRCLFLLISVTGMLSATPLQELPVAYGGRYRPLEASARLWLQEVGVQSSPHSAPDQVLRLHFFNREGPELRALPTNRGTGEWLPLGLLETESGNFTAFSDESFAHIRHAYRAITDAVASGVTEEQWSRLTQQLAEALLDSYRPLAGTIVRNSPAGSVQYPSLLRLQAEVWYYACPLIPLAMTCYILGSVLLFLRSRWGTRCLLLGWLMHTAALALRCFILARPPVSNMFETVLFVPWIAMLVGLIWNSITANRWILAAAATSSVALLALLQMTHLSSGMENVQAVLNSQYWLIIHVLMVVSSYGVFVLCGLLGHVYLIKPNERLGNAILHAMYLGTALLIPGTLLGGVWAAQSWGRFWDWDPKESWAFITACVYLVVIHAYRFHKIGHWGLANGAILGLLAVSFTWYGVNYILGSGLHSYGFGSGGAGFYYAFIVCELVFVIIFNAKTRRREEWLT